jgi:hypothetical protein
MADARTSAVTAEHDGQRHRARRSAAAVADRRVQRDLELGWGYLAFARTATFAFIGVSVYTVAVKGSGGGLAGDWLHTALHLATGTVAAVAAYRGSTLLAALVTGAVAVAYGVLAAVGPLVDGLFLGTAAAVPLATADDIFHGLLAAGAVAALFAESRRRR